MKASAKFITLLLLGQLPRKNCAPCNLFPKIFGGSLGDTRSTSMDANLEKDIIVATGWTSDTGLAGVSLPGGTIPFVIAYSISSTRIYWARGDLSLSGYLPTFISLSPNANFTIVHIPA
jgi:hypothetical protein